MKSIVALIIAFLITSSVFAESSRRIENGVDHGLGAGGSVFWTWGFLYRHHYEDRFGFSASLGGWFDTHGGHLGNSLGLLYTLAHHQSFWRAAPSLSIRVYLVAYLSNIYFRRHYHDDSPNSLHTGLGFGPGLEIFLNRHFGLHLELPWMTFTTLNDKGLRFRDSHPHFGGGLIYYF